MRGERQGRAALAHAGLPDKAAGTSDDKAASGLQEAMEMVVALEEPSEEPADLWASMEAAVDVVVVASAAEEATVVECLDSAVIIFFL